MAYLPGLAMRRIAALPAGEATIDARDAAIIAEAACSMPHTLPSLRLAGEATIDARDAAIIAEAACSMPHTLPSLRLADEPLAELTMLCSFDDDLAAQITRPATVFAACLPRSIPRSSEFQDRDWITRQ